ncbi:hypothetical protein [Desulfobulbus propionicus]
MKKRENRKNEISVALYLGNAPVAGHLTNPGDGIIICDSLSLPVVFVTGCHRVDDPPLSMIVVLVKSHGNDVPCIVMQRYGDARLLDF